jgi:hypothetical protein
MSGARLDARPSRPACSKARARDRPKRSATRSVPTGGGRCCRGSSGLDRRHVSGMPANLMRGSRESSAQLRLCVTRSGRLLRQCPAMVSASSYVVANVRADGSSDAFLLAPAPDSFRWDGVATRNDQQIASAQIDGKHACPRTREYSGSLSRRWRRNHTRLVFARRPVRATRNSWPDAPRSPVRLMSAFPAARRATSSPLSRAWATSM